MLHRVKKVFELEASTGIFLIIATAVALLIANSNSYEIYHNFLQIPLPLNIDFVGLHKDLTVHGWINDGMMTIFFFLIGLELKEEVMGGELSTKKKAMLPAIGAVGGIVLPTLVFYLYNHNHPENMVGFAIPAATDIAFAYGVLCLFGKKIPKSLKVFLISLAIFDDLAAILIIALFYSKKLSVIYIIGAFLVMAVLAFVNYKKSKNIYLYFVLGVALWLMFLKSGIHATVSGVILAMFIPNSDGVIKNLEARIGPMVNFLILPIFAFANSGVRIGNFDSSILVDPLFLGVTTGLFFGKQIGVMFFSFCGIMLKLTHLPRGQKTIGWLEFYGVCILTGIGFTMSYFIGSLSFPNNHLAFDTVKLAVLVGSFLSAVLGIVVIYISLKLNGKRAQVNEDWQSLVVD